MKNEAVDTMHEVQLTLPPGLAPPKPEVEHEVLAIHELSISGYRMLLVLGIAVIAMGPVLWTVIRHWLFAP
ncbi:MAG TPA: hypothetical protein VJN93_00325 [Candidatus Acidoferrum sp.]|nr:hypothetical protein [Candidatus Acidoferrum sp.]